MKCPTGQPYLCDGGQFVCGLTHPGCSVANDATGCPNQPHNTDKSLDAKVIEHIEWSIGHQGARVWNGDLLKTGATLSDAVQRPMGSGVNRDQVANSYSTYGSLAAPVAAAVRQCQLHNPPTQVVQHMDFVCNRSDNHGDKSRDILHRADINDTDSIRSAFSKSESDDKIKNILYCYNGTDVKAIVRQQCH